MTSSIYKYKDLDSFVDDVEYKMRLVQLQRGFASLTINKFEVDQNIYVYHINVNKKIHILDDECCDKIRLHIPFYPESVDGSQISTGNIYCYQPHSNYSSVLGERYDSIEIHLNICDDLAVWSRYLEEHRFKKVFLPRTRMDRNVAEKVEFLRRLLWEVRDPELNLRDKDIYKNSIAKCTFGIISYFFDNIGIGHQAGIKEDNIDVLNQSLKEIRSAGGVIKVSEIAKQVGVSQRTIYNLFIRHFNLTPSQYINSYKLCSAYRQLRAVRQVDDPVTRAALDAGFDHLGRFSQRYNEFFGELPSATIRGRLRP